MKTTRATRFAASFCVCMACFCLFAAEAAEPYEFVEAWPDTRRGLHFVLEVQNPKGVSLADAREGVILVLTQRIKRAGVSEAIVQGQGRDRIVVKLPGVAEVNRYRRLIERQADTRCMLVDEPRMRLPLYSEEKLLGLYQTAVEELDAEFEGKKDDWGNPVEWRMSDLDRKLADSLPLGAILRIYEHEGRSPEGQRVVKKTPLLLQCPPHDPYVLNGGEIIAAEARDPDGGHPVVSFTLSRKGAKKFAEVTRQYNARSRNRIRTACGDRGWRLGILLDDKVISAASIRTEIPGGLAQIEGDFTLEEARDLAIQLELGALPASVRIVDQREGVPIFQAYSFRGDVLNEPVGIAVDASGNVFVAGTGRVKKFDASGKFLCRWGRRGTWDNQFWLPMAIAVDHKGHILVADLAGGAIRRYDSSGKFLRKFDTKSSEEEEIAFPIAIGVDSKGSIFLAYHPSEEIRKVDSSGKLLAKWGSDGSDDGQFSRLRGIAVDSEGNVYVADTYNFRIQKFDSSGKFLSKWGRKGDGDGEFSCPAGIAVDSEGNVFVTDTENCRIQKFDSSGKFLTKWGLYGHGDGEFGFPGPIAIAVDSKGNVSVVDFGNRRIQKFRPSR